jgi:Fe2+ or Zn2+ uptake regulation protein
MKKAVINEKVAAVKSETQLALQTVYDALNQGQQKKVVKDEAVKTLFDRYGVQYTE